MAKNPYIKEPEKQPEDWLDSAAGLAKGADVVAKVPSLFGTIGGNGLASMFSWLPGIKPKDATGLINDSAADALKSTGVDNLMAGITFGARAVQAVGEFAQGDVKGGIKKLVRGAVEATVVLFNVSGLGVALELGSKFITGKFLSTHAGDAAENVAKAIMGGDDNPRDAKVEGAISLPAAATVIGGGILATGLAANHFKGKNGNDYTFGAPPGNRGVNDSIETINSATPQAIKGVRQVMDVNYPLEIAQEQTATNEITEEEVPKFGMSKTFWRTSMRNQGIGPEGRRLMAEQNAAANQNAGTPTIESGNGIFGNVEQRAASFTGAETQRDEQRELEMAGGKRK